VTHLVFSIYGVQVTGASTISIVSLKVLQLFLLVWPIYTEMSIGMRSLQRYNFITSNFLTHAHMHAWHDAVPIE
jgi:hypothetical protein